MNRNSALAVIDKVKEHSQNHLAAYRVGGVTGAVTGILMNPGITAFAAEASGGTNILDGETLNVITNAFSSLGITVTAIVVMAMSATVGVMMLGQACDYALKRMKAAFKKAA